jgi:hypothetical protein
MEENEEEALKTYFNLQQKGIFCVLLGINNLHVMLLLFIIMSLGT